MPASDKKTEQIKAWVDEKLFVDLNRLAIADDRSLSEYMYLVLSRHAYGNLARRPENEEGPNRADSGRN